MCLMLYLGTPSPPPLASSADLRIEPIGEGRDAVRQWFSQPFVHFVGAHTGCSCGFPSVIASSPVAYVEGMRLESDDREADLRSVSALLAALSSHGRAGRTGGPAGTVELYPIADGQEGVPPKGVIEWRWRDLRADRLVFNEGFLHVVRIAD